MDTKDDVEIKRLEQRVKSMCEKNAKVELDYEKVDETLKRVLDSIIERIQIKAAEVGFVALLGPDHTQEIIEEWAENYRPDTCALCGRFFASRLEYWYFDFNGNIVHEICYKRAHISYRYKGAEDEK